MAKKPSKNKTESVSMPVVDLSIIVSAGAEGMYVPDSVSGPLAAAGLVEVNPGLANEAGEHACRATAAGIAKVEGVQVVSAPVEAAAPSFAIDAGVPIPAPVGRGRSGSKYPFDVLEVGQSFFVPDTAEHPDAAASMASTVSGATQRYATDHPTERKTVKGKEVPKKVYGRKFALRKIAARAQGCGPNGEGGARVWRVEVSGVAE